jgi:hypothetical protein
MAKNKQDLWKFEVVLFYDLNNKLVPLILPDHVKSRRCVSDLKSGPTRLKWDFGLVDLWYSFLMP